MMKENDPINLFLMAIAFLIFVLSLILFMVCADSIIHPVETNTYERCLLSCPTSWGNKDLSCIMVCSAYEHSRSLIVHDGGRVEI